MDPVDADELQRLRARAYGPNGDGALDQGEAERLRVLEEQLRPAAPVVEAVEHSELTPAVDSATEEVSDGGLAAEPAGQPKRLPFPIRAPRLWHWVWAGSVVLAAGLAGVIVFSLTWMAPVATSNGVPQIATLERDPSIHVPQDFFGATEEPPAFEYYGLTIVVTDDYYFGGGSDCLVVIDSASLAKIAESEGTDGWSIDGFMQSGCGMGRFPAALAIPTDLSDLSGQPTPEAFAVKFPPGGALQFARDGDRVGVFYDDSVAED